MTKAIKFVLRLLLRLLYRVEVSGMTHYRESGRRVLIIANHSSLLDGILLYAWLPETPTFAINTQIASRPLFKPFLRFVDLFMMDPTNPLSVKSLIRFIREDRKAVVFPEGRLTVTGIPMKVYEGPGMVADKAAATILPIAIDGAQFSPFSYMHGRGRIVWFPKISLTVLPPERLNIDRAVQGHARRKAAGQAMHRLMLRIFYATYDYRSSVFAAVVRAARQHGMGRIILEDINREPIRYRQLIMRVLILAHALRGHGAAGDRVGLLLPNAAVTPIVFLALHYLGRVPAMLNYTAGPQSVLRACETGRVRLVYTSRKFVAAGQLEELIAALQPGLQVVFLEDLRATISALDKLRGWFKGLRPEWHYRQDCERRDPDGESVLLFTSGSEGHPKGVLLSHANLLSNYAQVRCLIDYRSSDLMFSCLPLFHSFGLNGGLLMPMLGGSRVFLYPTPLHYRIIPELIYELGATILFGTSTFFKGYAHHAHPFDFQSLRYAVAGAERLRDDTQRTWMEKFGIRILQGYGVTEASPV
ncbi:MAG: AMP-binding protein, partial [Gammaproteobacteria bacterium]